MKSRRELINLMESQTTVNENQVEIDNLTTRQKVLADIVWACDSQEQLNQFMAGLPTQELKREVASIVEVMVMSAMEKDVQDQSSHAVSAYLKKF